MDELAPGVFLLSGQPRHAINIYLAGGVLIDAGTRHARRRPTRSPGGCAKATRLPASTCWR